MEGNKDEAVRCVQIAEEAIASGNKEKALKFIKFAQRLNGNLPVSELLVKCESIDSKSRAEFDNAGTEIREEPSSGRAEKGLNGERSYTEEHVQLIRKIKRDRDYYEVLGVEKSCSVEEIRKAYRKLSLKVHPDKNKAPGSEEAFKKVSKAFKCLSEEGSRRQYDQTGLVDEFEHNQRHNNVRHRRRRNGHEFFEDEFDPDEVFRAFFGQGNVFRAGHVYRARGMGAQPREDINGGGLNFMLLLQVLPFLIIVLLAYLPFSEPEYSLQKSHAYQVPQTTENHGVEFYVKSTAFEEKYPIGSSDRADIENTVIKDYKTMLSRYCQVELQRRHWNRNMPIPHCKKLQSFG